MENNEFVKGSYVVYGTNGICLVEDVQAMSFAAGMEKDTYYILKPEGNGGSTIFVPGKNVELMSRMRALMTKDEIDSLLRGMKEKALEWEEDRRLRSELFRNILVRGVRQELLLMIRCIYLRSKDLEEMGKKLSAADSNMLKSAEKLVEEEFSHVLGITPDEVGGYIRKALGIPS